MADHFEISAQMREVTGKKVKQLRREGMIPAIIYGQQAAVSIQLENFALRRVLRDAGATSLIDIRLDDGQRTVLAREIQTHVTRGDLIHVDFYEVDLKQKVTAEAALVTVGESTLEAEGQGTITQLEYNMEIEALPDDLISEIEIDVSLIVTPDDVITVQDLVVPEGVSILADPETPLARFTFIALEEEEEEEEELLEADAGDVDVVPKGKAEDEEGEADE